VPTYQYACTSCGHQLEAVQSFADEPLTECPACEGRLRKLFNSVGIVFKGSGFYRTDSRSAGSDSSSDTSADKSKSSSGDATSTTPSSNGADNGSSSGSKPKPTKPTSGTSTTSSTTSAA
jgi:putative FmdB family regulatory protein